MWGGAGLLLAQEGGREEGKRARPRHAGVTAISCERGIIGYEGTEGHRYRAIELGISPLDSSNSEVKSDTYESHYEVISPLEVWRSMAGVIDVLVHLHPGLLTPQTRVGILRHAFALREDVRAVRAIA